MKPLAERVVHSGTHWFVDRHRTATIITKAAICAAVVLFFSVAFLASWKAAQGLQQRAISAKTSAYSDTVHAAQADTCSVSHSFSWSINSHEVKSNPHYCVLLAKQVEARSSNIHLRRVYCTKCPSTCHAYKDICADKTCYAAPTVTVPTNTMPWPASCAHVTTGTTCSSTCQPGFKPATEGSPPSTTCMTGDVADQSPYMDAWTPPMGSCIPDRLELQHVIKALREYHVFETLSCLVWCYCAWFVRAFGVSTLANLVDIKYPILQSTIAVPDQWTEQGLVELAIVAAIASYMTAEMQLVDAAAAAAAVGVTVFLFSLAFSRLCERVYALHSYAACYALLYLVEPAVAASIWAIRTIHTAWKPVWCRVQPTLAQEVAYSLQLSHMFATQCLDALEVVIDLEFICVPGETTIMFEGDADATAPRSRSSSRGGSAPSGSKVSFAANFSPLACLHAAKRNIIGYIQLMRQLLYMAAPVLFKSASGKTAGVVLSGHRSSIRFSEVDEPLHTIVEEDESIAAAESNEQQAGVAPDCICNVDGSFTGSGLGGVANKGSAAGIGLGSLLSPGSDDGVMVQIALSPGHQAVAASKIDL